MLPVLAVQMERLETTVLTGLMVLPVLTGLMVLPVVTERMELTVLMVLPERKVKPVPKAIPVNKDH